MPDANLIKLIQKNLVAMLRGSAGTPMFRHFYVRRKSDGQELDTMRGGELACAYYVSGVLAIFGLIDRAHSTTATTLAKLKEAGWVQIGEARPGAVVLWPEYEGYDHIGFVLDGGQCISHSLSKRSPHIHGAALSDGRQPIAYYWHTALRQE